MKINVDFTLEIKQEDIPAMKAAAGDVETEAEIRNFIRGDVADFITDYLQGLDVPCTIIRELF